MNTPDIAGLCERLKSVRYVREGRDDRDYVCDLSCDSDDYGARPILRNPDGLEAADTLERQAAEIERLRGAAQAANRIRITALVYEDADLLEDIEMVLAALTGEDPGGTG